MSIDNKHSQIETLATQIDKKSTGGVWGSSIREEENLSSPTHPIDSDHCDFPPAYSAQYAAETLPNDSGASLTAESLRQAMLKLARRTGLPSDKQQTPIDFTDLLTPRLHPTICMALETAVIRGEAILKITEMNGSLRLEVL